MNCFEPFKALISSSACLIHHLIRSICNCRFVSSSIWTMARILAIDCSNAFFSFNLNSEGYARISFTRPTTFTFEFSLDDLPGLVTGVDRLHSTVQLECVSRDHSFGIIVDTWWNKRWRVECHLIVVHERTHGIRTPNRSKHREWSIFEKGIDISPESCHSHRLP